MTRLVSGVVLALAAVAAIVWLPLVALRVLAAAVAGAAGFEYAAAAGVTRDLSRALIVVMAAVTCWWLGMPAFASVAVATAIGLAWLAVEVLLFGHDIARAAAAVAGAVYIGGPLGMLVAIHARAGWRVTLLLIATVVVSDTAQYYSGRAFGRRPLAPIVSPKHDFVPVIICFLRVQAVAGPVHLCTSADPPDGCRTVRTVRQP